MALRDENKGKGCITSDGHELQQHKYVKEQKGFLIPTLGLEIPKGAKPEFLHNLHVRFVNEVHLNGVTTLCLVFTRKRLIQQASAVSQ